MINEEVARKILEEAYKGTLICADRILIESMEKPKEVSPLYIHPKLRVQYYGDLKFIETLRHTNPWIPCISVARVGRDYIVDFRRATRLENVGLPCDEVVPFINREVRDYLISQTSILNYSNGEGLEILARFSESNAEEHLRRIGTTENRMVGLLIPGVAVRMNS